MVNTILERSLFRWRVLMLVMLPIFCRYDPIEIEILRLP